MAEWGDTQAAVKTFLHEQVLCVVSSLAEDGRPQSATVAFSETEQLELMIGTSSASRKYANLKRDDRVAVVVTDPDAKMTVQYEGRARQVTGDELAERQKNHYAKLPFSLPFKDLPDQAFFVITPVWIRFSDLKVYPWNVKEWTF